MSTFKYSDGDQPLDGFTIEHALGRGGFGEVYFAKSDAGREVALKVIQNYEDIELRGISHCMNLKSPHLVTIFDVKHDASGRPWVVMEYVAGPCLKELLDEADAESLDGKKPAPNRSKGIGEDQAMYFMRELIKGMRYLHDSGVVHRDLKPHNIFFEDGSVKIGDYSLSKAISASHRSGHTTTVGSVHYMAPEIGEGKYGKAVDIYALGVILFEMLTGNPPYVGESMGEVLIKHLTSEPDVSGINPVLGNVITKAMARQPEDRFQSVDEMLHALCPEDHSSYLPAPASLSMIGDRAAARRDRQPSGRRFGVTDDTFIKIPGLIDTKEDSQSQPFERPVPSAPDSLFSWLDTAGILWQPYQGELLKPEQLPLYRRVIVAVLIGFCFALLAAVVSNTSFFQLILLMILFPVTGMAFCLAFLQALPRSELRFWKIINRHIGAVIILGGGLLIYMFLVVGGMDHLVEGNHLPMIILGSMLIDWRCFISISRYPRVGMAKTMTVLAVFGFMMLLIEPNRLDQAVFDLIIVAAVTLSIQILAPHGRTNRPQHKGATPDRPSEIQSRAEDRFETETRFESDSILLKEKI